MRTVAGALSGALPGMGSIVAILLLVFYVAAVMVTWLFFVPFIFATSFTVLNLFIALIVNSMQSLHSGT